MRNIELVYLSGNSGTGKSTVGPGLAQYLGAAFIPEPVGSNPFLGQYYSEPNRWAFAVQCRFILDRYRNICDAIANGVSSLVVDRSISEDVEIFARVWLETGALTPSEFETIDILSRSLHLPESYCIYLHAPTETLWSRVSERGLEVEKGFEKNLLGRRQQKYEEWYGRQGMRAIAWSTEGMSRDDLISTVPSLAKSLHHRRA